jgi:hypothetical protein
MSAQTPYALTIPEILCEVLEHLEYNRRALFAACLVNSTWTEPSLNLLWRNHHRDGMICLESLPECRRQFYADKIQSLSMNMGPSQPQHSTETLDFPRLRILGVWLSENDWNFGNLLVPTLEVFRLYGGTSQAENYLRQLPDRCTSLRELCVNHLNVGRLDFHRLEDYLKKFSKLQSVDLSGMSDSAMTDEVFLHLASLPLCALHMNKPITTEVIDMAYRQQRSNNLFRRVVRLEIKMEWCAATLLIPTLTTLRSLTLELLSADTNHKAFQAIGLLTELRDLNLHIPLKVEKRLNREEILAIGKLHELRNLGLDNDSGAPLILDDSVTDDDLVNFFSSFPQAESIHIEALCTSFIPSSVTIALALTSTRLSSFHLDATLDSGFIDSSTTRLFPNLESLYLQRLYASDVPTEG